jgi:lipoprotein-anchoring transpeptidase ErfK/SrfK
MHRSIIIFAAVVAATSAAAFSGQLNDASSNASAVVNGAFAAMAASNDARASSSALAFTPLDAPAGALALVPTNIPVSTQAFTPAPTPASASTQAPVSTPPEPTIVITVDKSTQRMRVVVNGVQRWNWAVSTGRRGYATPAGAFRPFRMARDHRSREWDNAPMPYSIFFTQRGHAIHGSFATGRLGSPASHGCVRLDTSHARELFALVQRHGVSNTRVVITGSERAPAAVARAQSTPRTQAKTRTRTPQSAPSSQHASRASLQHMAHQAIESPRRSNAPLSVAPRGFAPSAH